MHKAYEKRIVCVKLKEINKKKEREKETQQGGPAHTQLVIY